MRFQLELESGSNRFGSQMGRRDLLPENRHSFNARIHLVKVRMDGAYDCAGAYWGLGAPIYCAIYEDEIGLVRVFVRAHDRTSAKRAVQTSLPLARFYR